MRVIYETYAFNSAQFNSASQVAVVRRVKLRQFVNEKKMHISISYMRSGPIG